MTKAHVRKCNAQEVLFVMDYVIHGVAHRAAIKAKYAETTAQVKAPGWVKNSLDGGTKPWVYDAVQAELAKVVKRARKTKDDIIAELENLAFSNMQDVFKINEEGKLEFRLENLTRDQAAALSQMIVDGDKTTIKLVDKRASLVDLGKEYGMFKAQHEVGGPAGGPIEVSDAGRNDLARRVAFMLEVAAREVEAE